MASLFEILAGTTTIVAFVAFLGIVAWAYSKHRRDAFAQAANAPFALPDEGAADHIAQGRS